MPWRRVDHPGVGVNGDLGGVTLSQENLVAVARAIRRGEADDLERVSARRR